MLKTRAFLIIVCSLGVGLTFSACAVARATPQEAGNTIAGGTSWLQVWQAVTVNGNGEATSLEQSARWGRIYKSSEGYRAAGQLIQPSFHYGDCPFSDD